MGLINCWLENLLYETRVEKTRYPVQFQLTLIPSPTGDTDIEILTSLYCLQTFSYNCAFFNRSMIHFPFYIWYRRILNAKMSVNLFWNVLLIIVLLSLCLSCLQACFLGFEVALKCLNYIAPDWWFHSYDWWGILYDWYLNTFFFCSTVLQPFLVSF